MLTSATPISRTISLKVHSRLKAFCLSVVANVYIYSLEELLLRGSLLPCHKMLKTANFPRDLRLLQVNETLAKFAIRLITVLYILIFFTCKEENKRKISLVLYSAFANYYDPAILRNKLTPFSIFRDLALRKRD